MAAVRLSSAGCCCSQHVTRLTVGGHVVCVQTFVHTLSLNTTWYMAHPGLPGIPGAADMVCIKHQ